ncbi:MAG TPA: VWA-like domain-containing protein [Chloroflexota bacterium]|nr:VWA-like domain-containing protein [Chloroflexota bacterium]
MNAAITPSPEERRALDAVQSALRLVCVSLPHLAGLARLVRIELSARVGTIGIFPSGRLVANPAWFSGLDRGAATFVVAHELLHLALQTAQRAAGTHPLLFNCAHDYIINDMLTQALGRPVPEGAMDWPGASELSAESLVQQLAPFARAGAISARAWGGGTPEVPDTAMAAALRAVGLVGPPGSEADADGDVLSDELEHEWFPATDWAEEARARGEVERAAARAASLDGLREAAERLLEGREHEASSTRTALYRGLRTYYAPPWELALQRWLEGVALGVRSYERPSRRGAPQPDVALAGRRREGWTLHIVIDTSGSMEDELSRALGAISAFCDSVNVADVHLLQCDDELTRDEWVAPETLGRFEIAGFGGSDLSPAMLRLAEDPTVEAAVVITDGEIDYPEAPLPYAVLWVLTQANEDFAPPYGALLTLPPARP